MHTFSLTFKAIAAVLTILSVPTLADCSPANNTTTACSWVPGIKSAPYPSECHIQKVFSYFEAGNFSAFFSQVSPSVHWTIMGTHPLAGSYHNRTIFLTDTLQRLGYTLDPTKPTSTKLYQIIGAGGEWSGQEVHATGVCKNGEPPLCSKIIHVAAKFKKLLGQKSLANIVNPGLVYDNWFSWNSRWNTEGIIVEMRAYFDSALVTKVITENESGTFNYTVERTASFPGPLGVNCAVPK
jgi:ketosteroid isomerase-like protein